MWTEDSKVDIQSFSSNHVSMLIKLKDMDRMRFTSFYNHLELSPKHHS